MEKSKKALEYFETIVLIILIAIELICLIEHNSALACAFSSFYFMVDAFHYRRKYEELSEINKNKHE